MLKGCLDYNKVTPLKREGFKLPFAWLQAAESSEPADLYL